jgi:40S ribosome biogenesis protein Tsr1 and BMS1 C-terminal
MLVSHLTTAVNANLSKLCIARSITQVATRHGTIDSIKGEPTASGTYTSAIAKGLFNPEEDIKLYIGTAVHTANGEIGTVTAAFGKAGKCRISFDAVSGTSSVVGTAVWMQEQA